MARSEWTKETESNVKIGQSGERCASLESIKFRILNMMHWQAAILTSKGKQRGEVCRKRICSLIFSS